MYGIRSVPYVMYGNGHINVLGRYDFTLPEKVIRGELRPLRNPEIRGDDTR